MTGGPFGGQSLNPYAIHNAVGPGVGLPGGGLPPGHPLAQAYQKLLSGGVGQYAAL